jgi:hypothetical protein
MFGTDAIGFESVGDLDYRSAFQGTISGLRPVIASIGESALQGRDDRHRSRKARTESLGNFVAFAFLVRSDLVEARVVDGLVGDIEEGRELVCVSGRHV